MSIITSFLSNWLRYRAEFMCGASIAIAVLGPLQTVQPSSAPIIAVGSAIDAMLLIDCVLSLLKTTNLARSQALVSVVSVFPVCLVAVTLSALGLSVRWNAVAIARCMQLLTLRYLVAMFNTHEARLQSSVSWSRGIKFTTIVALSAHVCTCLVIFASRPFGVGVAGSTLGIDYPSFGRLYTDGMYYSVALLTSTGYGDIHASSAADMIVAVIVIIYGKVLFGFVLGHMAAVLVS